MKIGFIGCVESSLRALETLLLLKSEEIEVVAVVTKQKSGFNADFVDLAPLCRQHDIPFHYEDSNERELSVEFLQQHKPDVIYCFGWSFLLKADLLTLAPNGVIGFHPAQLPKNRGRHPIIWALALGLTSTSSTFFKMDEGADSGPILSQKELPILSSDDAASLYERILDVAQEQIVEFTKLLAKGEATYVEQDHQKASYWRKRTRKDGLIDWRMQAEDIHNLIRALTKPYPGAEFEYQKQLVSVWKSQVCEHSHPRNIEPGYILAKKERDILVKCGGEGAIWLYGIESDELPQVGEYL